MINAANINIYGVNGLGGSITAAGQGFLHDDGSGAGGVGSFGYGAGAGYGGAGGDGDDGAAGGGTYGVPSNPVELGSGGGTTGGGSGGGSIALNLYKNQVTDVSGLAGLESLQFVDLHGNVIADFSGVEHVATVYRDTDCDRDNMLDAWEMAHFGTLSNNGTGDFDRDALSDLREYQRRTNPKDADSDSDGMSDGWEVGHGLDPLNDDARADPDGDGLLNWEEYVAGTDPTKWTLLLSLLSPEHGAGVSLTTPPIFTWACSGPAQFKLEFAAEADFSKIRITVPGRRNQWLSGLSCSPSRRDWNDIRRNGCSYWRVRATAQGSEYVSEVRIFTMERTSRETIKRDSRW